MSHFRALSTIYPLSIRRAVVRKFFLIAPIRAVDTQPRRCRHVSQWSSEESQDTTRRELTDQTNEKSDGEDHESQEPIAEETDITTIPWYLQVNAPKKLELSERQYIPDLPELPPPILQPLMHQVSIDLGLDDLTLLDLRKLDPPPALGANLLMLLATARSEKHLHVSADRLCRWLRSEYRLRPDADGLLGRNELKTRLKRKARRTKLLGSSDENSDDGIRSGWVCVDVGIVDASEDTEKSTPPKDFVGFGRRTEGVRIVVQMLTEEKRSEIDLEGLWSSILRRSQQGYITENPEEENFSSQKKDVQII
ncbi:hypothetical protein K3495_g10661 [Podosphaera aphanis]|nr:hypothetical protein K3495_g10661 [Podosphaera aphanis]